MASREEIEAQIRDIQSKKKSLPQPLPPTAAADGADAKNGDERIGLGVAGNFDEEIYGGTNSKFEGYVSSIAVGEEVEDDDDYSAATNISTLGKPKGYTAPLALLNQNAQAEAGKDYEPFAEHRVPKIAERQNEYQARARTRAISPERHDPFSLGT